jgi:hypothetical protein
MPLHYMDEAYNELLYSFSFMDEWCPIPVRFACCTFDLYTQDLGRFCLCFQNFVFQKSNNVDIILCPFVFAISKNASSLQKTLQLVACITF